jgi:hypothetical protein
LLTPSAVDYPNPPNAGTLPLRAAVKDTLRGDTMNPHEDETWQDQARKLLQWMQDPEPHLAIAERHEEQDTARKGKWVCMCDDCGFAKFMQAEMAMEMVNGILEKLEQWRKRVDPEQPHAEALLRGIDAIMDKVEGFPLEVMPDEWRRSILEDLTPEERQRLFPDDSRDSV